MPSFNMQMLSNMLASALTATFTAWLTYLAAWSHFSSEQNTGLAALLAAGAAIVICQIVTYAINRWSVIVGQVTKDGSKVVTPTQAAADALPHNPNVMGPEEAKVVKS